jgi:hypothetical protein
VPMGGKAVSGSRMRPTPSSCEHPYPRSIVRDGASYYAGFLPVELQRPVRGPMSDAAGAAELGASSKNDVKPTSFAGGVGPSIRAIMV